MALRRVGVIYFVLWMARLLQLEPPHAACGYSRPIFESLLDPALRRAFWYFPKRYILKLKNNYLSMA